MQVRGVADSRASLETALPKLNKPHSAGAASCEASERATPPRPSQNSPARRFPALRRNKPGHYMRQVAQY